MLSYVLSEPKKLLVIILIFPKTIPMRNMKHRFSKMPFVCFNESTDASEVRARFGVHNLYAIKIC